MPLRALTACLTLCIACSATTASAAERQADRTPVNINYEYLDQGWTWEERERFWLLGQGSEIMPFEWFLHLEQADSAILFIDPKNIQRLGYVPWPTDAQGSEPDDTKRVPIGFTRAANPHTGEVWLGMNCSACHTNTVRYGDTTFLIEGAPTHGDYWQFNLDVTDALRKTYEEEEKFSRFSSRLGGDPVRLKARLEEVLADRIAYNERNRHDIEYGHGRLDAIGFIYNEVASGRLSRSGEPPNTGIPENRRPPEAPVSYPFLWGTSSADYVQWNGVSFAQTPLGNLARDTVEVLGVYGKIEIDCENGSFESSVLFRESKELGDMVATLAPPAWPADVFPPIDLDDAHAGKELFADYCAGCHEAIPRQDWDRPYQSGLWPMEVIGTDMVYGANAVQWVESGCLQGENIMHLIGPELEKHGTVYSVVTHVALGAMMDNFGDAILPSLDSKGMLKNLEENGLVLREPKPIYKSRPLNGIWATGPYLHNGSVATLDDLLKPPIERAKTVYAGCPDFDPVNVGFACEGKPDVSAIDVSCPVETEEYPPVQGIRHGEVYEVLPFRDGRTPGAKARISDTGNCNVGHDIRNHDGGSFSAEERRKLIEYMKTL